MQIYTEDTPNANAKKFNITNLPNKIEQSYFFRSKSQAQQHSQIGSELFDIQGIAAVFIFQNFITITKKEEAQWQDLIDEIMDLLNKSNSMNIIDTSSTNDQKKQTNNNQSPDDQKIIQQIEQLLETRIRPSISKDGGDIHLKSYQNGIATVVLSGACVGCSQSKITLQHGVESMLKYYIPDIKAIECDEI